MRNEPTEGAGPGQGGQPDDLRPGGPGHRDAGGLAPSFCANEPTEAVPARGRAGSPVTLARSGLAPRGLRSPGARSVTVPPGSSLLRTGRGTGRLWGGP